ncbi:MAG: histidine phosphatase family protein [Chloroflexaceae bacterium]|jgi:probable phosphoglycerate mutase|nr:histidine phosphatase family protein [Chloroflexaceae bacterium]
MTNLYLIRHGEAWGNVKPILAGMRGDEGLTPRGIAQAERLRDRLAATGEIAADVLIASDLPRARQTAEIIAPALKLPVQLDPEVQELNLGEADGMQNGDAWAKFGFPDFETQPLRPIAPGGESWGSFMLRVAAAFTRITRTHEGKTIVVVCHGGVIDGTFVHFFQMPSHVLPAAEFFTHNTSITHWQRHTREGRTNWRLVKYNDTLHLRDIGARESIRWKDVAPVPEDSAGQPAAPIPTEE